MSQSATTAILWQPAKHADADSGEFEYIHVSGRTFNLLKLEDGRYYPTEFIPNGRCVKWDESGRRVIDAWDEPRLMASKDTPSHFFKAIKEEGLEDSYVACGGGFGVGSLFYDTLDAANAAVWSAIERDEWLVSDSPQKAHRVMEENKLQHLQQSHAYTANIIERLEASKASLPALLKGAAPFTPSEENTKRLTQDLLAFRNNPGFETWKGIANLMLLPNGTTGWQLWCRFDADAPRSLPLNDNDESAFTTYPEPEAFFDWLRQEADNTLQDKYRRLRELEAEIEHETNNQESH